MSEKRQWTLAGAREMIPDVRSRTERSHERVEALWRERGQLSQGHPDSVRLEEAIEREVSRWAREMEALGTEVKGIWLVDFDNGTGYYCWRWPEEDVAYVHGYDEGFEGRRRIQ